MAHYDAMATCTCKRVDGTRKPAAVWTDLKACFVTPRTVVILCGAPGAGKGSQTPQLSALLGTPSLSTGDMLRAAVAAGTDVGKRAKAKMEAGELVSDEIVVGVIRDRIAEPDCAAGFILDGFPRTVEQANQLDAMLQAQGEGVSACIELNVPDEITSHAFPNQICAQAGAHRHLDTALIRTHPVSRLFGTDEHIIGRQIDTGYGPVWIIQLICDRFIRITLCLSAPKATRAASQQ